MSKQILFIAVAIAILLPIVEADAQTINTGRSVSLANSNPLNMYGVHAVTWNPANLGLKNNPAFSMRFPSISLSVGNNAFNPQYISDTFVEGKFLHQEDKDEIVGKLSEDKWELYGTAGMPAFGVSSGAIAFNFDLHSAGSAAIPGAVLEMALNGWVKDEMYNFDNVDEEAMIYSTVSLSAAKSMEYSFTSLITKLSLGATFKFILGYYYGNLERHDAYHVVSDEKIDAKGVFHYRHSKDGDGVGLDLGIVGYMPDIDSFIGLTIGNMFGNIHWTGVEVTETSYEIHDALDPDSLLGGSSYYENLFNKKDTTLIGESFKEPLPSYFMLSASKPLIIFNKESNLYISYYQGLNEAMGHSMTPRLALGSEWEIIPLLPIRFGVSFGGIEESVYSGGFGLNLKYFHLNFGASWQRGMLADAEGFSLAVTTDVMKPKPENVRKKEKRKKKRDLTAIIPTDKKALVTTDFDLERMEPGQKDYSVAMDPFRDGAVYYHFLKKKKKHKKYNTFFKQTAVVTGITKLAERIQVAIINKDERTMAKYLIFPDKKPVTEFESPLYVFVTETLHGSVKQALLLKVEADRLRKEVDKDFGKRESELKTTVILELEAAVEALEWSILRLPKLINTLGAAG